MDSTSSPQVKNKIVLVGLILVLAVVAFGYVPVPVAEFDAVTPGAPKVMGTKVGYVGNVIRYEIDVIDSNDPNLVVLAEGGTVTFDTIVDINECVEYVVVDPNENSRTIFIPQYKRTFIIDFYYDKPGIYYPKVEVVNSTGVADIKYVENKALKIETKPVITGCR